MCRGLFICLERTVRSSRPGREALVVCGAQVEGGCDYCTYRGQWARCFATHEPCGPPCLVAKPDHYVRGPFYMSIEDRAQF